MVDDITLHSKGVNRNIHILAVPHHQAGAVGEVGRRDGHVAHMRTGDEAHLVVGHDKIVVGHHKQGAQLLL